jgi:hypothetical protein
MALNMGPARPRATAFAPMLRGFRRGKCVDRPTPSGMADACPAADLVWHA